MQSQWLTVAYNRSVCEGVWAVKVADSEANKDGGGGGKPVGGLKYIDHACMHVWEVQEFLSSYN